MRRSTSIKSMCGGLRATRLGHHGEHLTHHAKAVGHSQRRVCRALLLLLLLLLDRGRQADGQVQRGSVHLIGFAGEILFGRHLCQEIPAAPALKCVQLVRRKKLALGSEQLCRTAAEAVSSRSVRPMRMQVLRSLMHAMAPAVGASRSG